MNSRWTLSDIEFSTLWAETKEGFALPTPLMALSRIRDAAEYDRHRILALERLRSLSDFDMAAVMRTLARPDISLAVDCSDPSSPGDPAELIRVHAARLGADGLVVRQLPGETVWHSGGFILIRCAAVDLARVVVEHLPIVPAGNLGEISLAILDTGLDHTYGRSPVRARAFSTSPGDTAVRRVFEAPAASIGAIEILQARSEFGPRGTLRYFLGWRDLAGDGRYLITDGNPPAVTPVDTQRFIAQINVRIATIVQALREERGR